MSWIRHWRAMWVQGVLVSLDVLSWQDHKALWDLLRTDWSSDSLLRQQLFWALCGDGSDPPSTLRVRLQCCAYSSHFLQHLAGSAQAAGNGLVWGDSVMLAAIVPDWWGHRTVESTPSEMECWEWVLSCACGQKIYKCLNMILLYDEGKNTTFNIFVFYKGKCKYHIFPIKETKQKKRVLNYSQRKQIKTPEWDWNI